jgi:4-amino-4-deoxy-L-arabinose transferase-like glycosyltransferase
MTTMANNKEPSGGRSAARRLRIHAFICLQSRDAKSVFLPLVLGAVLTFAFLIRFSIRLSFGKGSFWEHGYSLYYTLAENIVSGKGFCFDSTCAWLPPLYPLFLTLPVLSGGNYLLIVGLQSFFGAGTALCAFLIGRQIFSTFVGILACAMVSLYPYYVVHDTALQETGMVTLFTALSVWLLLRASRLNRNRDWILAGLALGAIPLIRNSAAPAVVVGAVWCAVWGTHGNYSTRLQKMLILVLTITIVTAPWLMRNYRIVGAPILTSQTGRALWTGNNPQTFSHYPAESIDRSREEAIRALSDKEHTDLKRLENDESGQSSWFSQRAITYIRQNPLRVAIGMLRKLEAAFSWRLNPVREPLAQVTYSLGYVPIAILGPVGMFLAGWRREVILVGLLFIAFGCVTAVFWAHTSHRSYLDVYWIVFTASVLERLWTIVVRTENARRPFTGMDV